MSRVRAMYVLGTCRAFDISRVANGKHFVLQNRGDVFLHTTKEILNIIDSKARRAIPRNLRKYITIREKFLRNINSSNFFIIEISSNKCVKIDEHYFKLHGNNVPNARDNIYRIKESEVIRDMKTICLKLSKPIIFISHISPEDAAGNPIISQRKMMRDIVQRGSIACNSLFFDPAEYICGDWNEYVDEDVYHYTDYGKKEIGNAFLDFLTKNEDRLI